MNRTEITIAFARYGVAMNTISRALALDTDEVELVCRRALDRGDIDRMPPQSSDNPREALYTEVVNLRAELFDAKDKIKQIRAKADSAAWSFQIAFGLTATEAEILASLVKHGRRNKPQLYHVCYADRIDDDTPEPKIINVFVCKLRAKLKPHGVEIKTCWSAGYELTPDMVQKCRVLAGQTEHQESDLAASVRLRVESPSIVPADGVLM